MVRQSSLMYRHLRESLPWKDYLEFLFWERVGKKNKNDCWLWKGSVDDKGYGRINVTFCSGKRFLILAHRLSYRLFRGKVRGLFVCHHCDNPACVNPHHLFLGTHQDNMGDKVRKGRQIRGEDNVHAKLTGADVMRVRELAATRRYTDRQLAKMFGVSDVNIHDIIVGKTWRYLPVFGIKRFRKEGESNPNAKLTKDKVREIRELHDTGRYSMVGLARIFGVSDFAIRSVILCKTWKHVE